MIVMKTLKIISIVWLVTTAVTVFYQVHNQKNVESSTTPLGLGVGLIPILIIAVIVVSVILIKTRKKYAYSWYPPNKI
jgi:heme/copper-type cytochrome/quinol oxidase subunit 2